MVARPRQSEQYFAILVYFNCSTLKTDKISQEWTLGHFWFSVVVVGGKCAAFLFNSMNRGDSFVDELNAPDRELICLIDFVHLIWQVE